MLLPTKERTSDSHLDLLRTQVDELYDRIAMIRKVFTGDSGNLYDPLFVKLMDACDEYSEEVSRIRSGEDRCLCDMCCTQTTRSLYLTA